MILRIYLYNDDFSILLLPFLLHSQLGSFGQTDYNCQLKLAAEMAKTSQNFNEAVVSSRFPLKPR